MKKLLCTFVICHLSFLSGIAGATIYKCPMPTDESLSFLTYGNYVDSDLSPCAASVSEKHCWRTWLKTNDRKQNSCVADIKTASNIPWIKKRVLIAIVL